MRKCHTAFHCQVCNCYSLAGWLVLKNQFIVRLEFLLIQQGLLSTYLLDVKDSFYLKDESRYVETQHMRCKILCSLSREMSHAVKDFSGVGEMSHAVRGFCGWCWGNVTCSEGFLWLVLGKCYMQ